MAQVQSGSGRERRNTATGAEALVRLLAGHGVRHIFGLCGDTSLPFYDALACLDHGMAHILTRDERHAAYMADAYARVTGRPGVCEGPSGGGATYILPGLVEANESSVPVLAITTDVATTAAGRFPLTELDQEALFRPLTKWNGVVRSPDVLPRMVRRAFREMTTGHCGSVHLGLPFDVQKAVVADDDIWADPAFSTYPGHRAEPREDTVAALTTCLLAAKHPVVVCGGGVVLSGACEELAALVERIDIPVVTSVSGQGALAETHPNCAGVAGSNGGSPATRALVEQADCVFFIGCRAGSVTTERWRCPKPGVTILHLDADPAVVGASYRTEAAVVADVKAGLAAINRSIAGAEPVSKAGHKAVAAAKTDKWRGFGALAESGERPIRPERVIAVLQELLPDEAVICADPGTPCPYFSAWYQWPRAGRHFITNRAHGALGYSLAAGIGAQIGRPDAKVVCAMGDGSFGMCAGELETVRRLDLPITIIIFSNGSYGWIKAGQKSGFGARYFSVDFSRTDHAAIGSAFGIRSWRVDDPAQLERTMREVLAHDGPTLVDIVTQPLEDAAAPVTEWVA